MARLAAALVVAVAAAVWWPAAVEGLGMNWGTQASHPLPPKAVVQLLKDNGIKKVKLFDTDFAAMSALAGSGVEVMVAIPNNMLRDMAGDSGAAKDWVKGNVKRYDFDGGVTINCQIPKWNPTGKWMITGKIWRIAKGSAIAKNRHRKKLREARATVATREISSILLILYFIQKSIYMGSELTELNKRDYIPKHPVKLTLT